MITRGVAIEAVVRTGLDVGCEVKAIDRVPGVLGRLEALTDRVVARVTVDIPPDEVVDTPEFSDDWHMNFVFRGPVAAMDIDRLDRIAGVHPYHVVLTGRVTQADVDRINDLGVPASLDVQVTGDVSPIEELYRLVPDSRRFGSRGPPTVARS